MACPDRQLRSRRPRGSSRAQGRRSGNRRPPLGCRLPEHATAVGKAGRPESALPGDKVARPRREKRWACATSQSLDRELRLGPGGDLAAWLRLLSLYRTFRPAPGINPRSDHWSLATGPGWRVMTAGLLVIRLEVDAESAQGAGPVSRRLPAIFLAEGGGMSLADSSYPLLNLFWTMCFFSVGDLDLDPGLGVHRHLRQS